jgi:hypothetical protein
MTFVLSSELATLSIHQASGIAQTTGNVPQMRTPTAYIAPWSKRPKKSQRSSSTGAAMQQARFVIDDDLAKGNHYHHRLMDYNNDSKTTFADVQRFFALLEQRIRKRLDVQNRQ